MLGLSNLAPADFEFDVPLLGYTIFQEFNGRRRKSVPDRDHILV